MPNPEGWKMKTNKAVLTAMVLCLCMIVTASTVMGTLSIPGREYTGHPGGSVDIPVTETARGYNSTSEIFNISYDYFVYNAPPYLAGASPLGLSLGSFIKQNFTSDEVTNITDGDIETGVVMSQGGALKGDWNGNGIGIYYLKALDLQVFDGLWIKKSVDMGVLGILVSNTTVGADICEGYITDANGDTISIAPWKNLTYVDDLHIGTEGGTISITEYMDEFGQIDNVTLILTGGTLPNGKGPSINEEIDHELILYDFHFYHTGATVSSVSISNNEGIPQPWAVDIATATGTITIITIHIPTTAVTGSYFVTVYDTAGNNATTTLQVTGNTNSIWIWIYPIIAIVAGIAMLGLSDMAADKKTNPILTIGLGVIGVICLVVGGIFITDIMGWWPAIGLI